MEEWKVIPDFPDYEVSNIGNVRRVGKSENLKPQIQKDGRKRIHLSKNGKAYWRQIYRLMAICFIPNTNNYPLIDHINRNPSDNRIENLRWCSHTQNNHNTIYINNKNNFQGAYKHRNKFISRLINNKKLIYIGVFNTAEEAHEAYVKKKKEIAGEFSPF